MHAAFTLMKSGASSDAEKELLSKKNINQLYHLVYLDHLEMFRGPWLFFEKRNLGQNLMRAGLKFRSLLSACTLPVEPIGILLITLN